MFQVGRGVAGQRSGQFVESREQRLQVRLRAGLQGLNRRVELEVVGTQKK